MRYLLILSLLLCSFFSFSQKKEPDSSFVKKLPVPHKAVNDFAGFLTSSERTTLEKELDAYFERTTNAIVIVTLDSLTDPKTKKEHTVEEAAWAYFNTWGIGDSVKNNGVLILVSRKPRRIRIEVGWGLVAVLDNNFCKEVIDLYMVPAFKNDFYFTGFKQAITALENRLNNPPAPEPDPKPAARGLRTSYYHGARSDDSEGGSIAKNFFLIITGFVGIIFIVVMAALRSGNGYSDGYYSRHGYHRHRHRHSTWLSNDNDSGSRSSFLDSSSSFSSFDSSSSSSSSSDSYGGGSSSGGGASGSW